MFRQIGDALPAMAMNLGKGLIALVFMGLFLLPDGFSDASSGTLVALALSGVVGITLGDTLYFMTLMRLGPRLTLLLGTLIPVTTALIAVLMLGERINAYAWMGIAVTLFGVTWVLWEKASAGSHQKQWRSGLFLGLLFVLANAGAIILTKIGVEDLPSMEASFIRQAWALIGLGMWGIATSSWGRWVSPLQDKRIAYRLLLASIIGAFLGTWLSIAALKYTHASVAAVLNSTSPLFILPLAMLFLKERPSTRSVAGAMMAVAGIGMYFVAIQNN